MSLTKINLFRILFIVALGLSVGSFSVFASFTFNLFIIFILTVILCFIILQKTIAIFDIKHITIPGFFFLYYAVTILPATSIIYLRESSPEKYTFLLAQIIFLLSFVAGTFIASAFFTNYKCRKTRNYFFKKFILNNARSKLIFFGILFFSSIATILYIFLVPVLPLFYAISHPGAYLDISNVREMSGKLFDVNWLRYVFSWTKHLFLPLLTIFTFTNYYLSRSGRWKLYFILSLIAAIFVGILNFEKGPVANIFILLVLTFFFLIKKITTKKFIVLGLVGLILIFSLPVSMIYLWTGMDVSTDSLIQISESMGKRIFYDKAYAAYQYFTVFPEATDGYLWGSGVRPLTWITGQPFFNIANYAFQKLIGGIESGTFSTIFYIFYYVNFGFLGIIFSSFFVGFFLLILQNYFVNTKKTPLIFSMYVFFMLLTMKLMSTALTTWLLSGGVLVLLILPKLIKFGADIFILNKRKQV